MALCSDSVTRTQSALCFRSALLSLMPSLTGFSLQAREATVASELSPTAM